MNIDHSLMLAIALVGSGLVYTLGLRRALGTGWRRLPLRRRWAVQLMAPCVALINWQARVILEANDDALVRAMLILTDAGGAAIAGVLVVLGLIYWWLGRPLPSRPPLG